MSMWILVLFVHAGILSDSDSMAITNIPNFMTKAQCETAGKAADALTSSTTKETRHVCVEQPKI